MYNGHEILSISDYVDIKYFQTVTGRFYFMKSYTNRNNCNDFCCLTIENNIVYIKKYVFCWKVGLLVRVLGSH